MNTLTLAMNLTSSLLILSALILPSCAYHFASGERGIPGGYDRISVPVFVNHTKEVGAEAYFTNAMVEEVERSHRAQVTNREEAQVVLEGTVTSVRYVQGTRISSDNSDFKLFPQGALLAKEYRALVTVSLALRRRSDDKILWSGAFDGEERYPAPIVVRPGANTVNPLYNQSARDLTLRSLAQEMMAEAHDRMTENF